MAFSPLAIAGKAITATTLLTNKQAFMRTLPEWRLAAAGANATVTEIISPRARTTCRMRLLSTFFLRTYTVFGETQPSGCAGETSDLRQTCGFITAHEQANFNPEQTSGVRWSTHHRTLGGNG
jgi:hypothetical protein